MAQLEHGVPFSVKQFFAIFKGIFFQYDERPCFTFYVFLKICELMNLYFQVKSNYIPVAGGRQHIVKPIPDHKETYQAAVEEVSEVLRQGHS